MYILGISAFYHDSAAALISDGNIVAAAQEERFTRIKHDSSFPKNAITYCLQEAGISLKEISRVVFYDKPLLKFDRLLETYISFAPKGLKSFFMSMPIWLKDKIFLKNNIKKELSILASIEIFEVPQILFSEHHQAHAASAFFPSPYEKASILCLDGVGEWATTTVWSGNGNQMKLEWELDFPHSLGLLYSAFTYYTGFVVNSGEYKLMGLAPYGNPKYVNLIKDNLIDIKDDGTFRLDMKYFNYATGLTMTSRKFHNLFNGPPRKPESTITQKEMDIARSIQVVTEEIILKLANSIHQEFKEDFLCLAGGVALNCVANGRLLREGPFKNIWIQPAAGDAGGALGAALAAWYQFLDKPRIAISGDSMCGSFLGPNFSNDVIKEFLEEGAVPHVYMEDDELFEKLAEILDGGNVVGWFQGRMEFGPRALGGRSIIGDPRNHKMQSIMNLKIKYRESFRPFAPAVLIEDVEKNFKHTGESPYMLLVAKIKNELLIPLTEKQKSMFGIEKLNIARSSLPAITHVDDSARLQTVSSETNPRFHRLLSAFKKRTNCSVLINTSFNVRDEPIVCTPKDAYQCFMRTEMDYLVLGNIVLDKKKQPETLLD